MADQTFNELHLMSIDGIPGQVLRGMYKDTSIDRFKRIIALMNQTAISSWENLQLFYMGNEMTNERTLQSYEIQDGGIIRFSITESTNEKREPPASSKILLSDTLVLPSYDEAAFGGKVLRTVFAVDVDSNRSHNVGPVTLGMPVKQFIQKVANALGIEAEHLRIIYSGKQLQEGRTLLDYNLQDEATVHCVLRVKGGLTL